MVKLNEKFSGQFIAERRLYSLRKDTIGFLNALNPPGVELLKLRVAEKRIDLPRARARTKKFHQRFVSLKKFSKSAGHIARKK